jgi:hypothetical protein
MAVAYPTAGEVNSLAGSRDSAARMFASLACRSASGWMDHQM